MSWKAEASKIYEARVVTDSHGEELRESDEQKALRLIAEMLICTVIAFAWATVAVFQWASDKDQITGARGQQRVAGHNFSGSASKAATRDSNRPAAPPSSTR